MSPRVKRVFAFLWTLHLIFPCPIFAEIAGEFISVVGKVSVQRETQVFEPKAGDKVEVKDVVSTGEKSGAKLTLIDKSSLSLGPRSKVEIKAFDFKVKNRLGIFSLHLGKLKALAEKGFGSDSRFEVQTPNAIAGVRGTEWISVVEVVQNATTSSFYTLQESITVANAALPSQAVTVGAGQFTTVAASLAPTVPAAFTPGMIQGISADLAAAPSGAGATGSATATTAGEATGTATAGAGAAGSAGAAAGTAAVAGVGAGTIGVGAAIAAAAAAAAAAAGGGGSTATTAHR